MHHRTWAIAAAAATIVGGAASASTVDVTWNSGASTTGTFNVSVGAASANVGGGRFVYDVSNAAGTALEGVGSIHSFCVELNEFAASANGVNVSSGNGIAGMVPDDDDGPGGFAAATPLDTDDLKALSWLFEAHFATVTAPGAMNSDIFAFQLAVWEIVYEQDPADGPLIYQVDGANEGVFRVNSGNSTAISTANGWLAGLNDADLTTQAVNGALVALSKDGFQDQITLIPLPAPVLMGLAGFGLAAVARRRLRQG